MLSELELLYRTRLPELRRVAAAIAGDRDAGRDAVQEAFATAIRRRRSHRGSGSLEAWVWAIVVNAARDARRRRRRASNRLLLARRCRRRASRAALTTIAQTQDSSEPLPR